MTSPALSPDPRTRARERFLEDLTLEERNLYESATLENIFYDASVSQKSHCAESTTFHLSSRIRPFVAAIDQYGHALDVLSNTYSLGMAPIWGSMRVLIKIASEFERYFEKLVDMFARIGDVLPRFRDYERLFPNHERLLQALSTVYVDIMKFCVKAKGVFRQAKHRSVVNSKIALKLAWKPFDRQFGHIIEDFRHHRKTVESEAAVANMIEDANSRALELANQLQLEKEKKETKRLQTLASLLAFKYWDRHANSQHKRYQDSGSWLIEHAVYRNWMEKTRSSCLWLHGIPGCGKTILTSKVIDTLSERLEKTEALAYCYCDYAEIITLETQTVVKTIVHQILKPLAIPEEVEEKVTKLFIQGNRTPNLDDLLSTIRLAASGFSKVYVVLDGIDECQKQDQQDVLYVINQITSIESPIFKVFVSSREESRISSALDCPRIQVLDDAVHKDIKDFASAGVQSRLDSGEMTIGNLALKEEVISELVAKAHGMFLWVSFQLDDLCEASSDSQIRETIRNLPEGLIETYARIVAKISKSKARITTARKILMWIICAQRPLRTDELAEAIAIEPLDPSWDSEKIPRDLGHMLASCGNLVTFEKEDQTVRLAHHTVQQFLIVPDDDQYNYPIQTRNEEANNLIGAICITYLSFSDFETQISIINPPNSLERSGILTAAGLSQVPSILGIGSNIINLAYRILPKSPGHEPVHLEYKTLSNAMKKDPPPTQMTEKYRLLDYAIKHWTSHTRNSKLLQAGSVDDPLWQAFKRLALEKNATFEFREWRERQGASSLPHYGLFVWAIEKGHAPLLQMIDYPKGKRVDGYYRYMIEYQSVEIGNKPFSESRLDISDARDESSISKACHLNHYKIISFLASRHVDLTSLDLLRYAIKGDSLETFEILYRLRADTRFEEGQNAFHLAAEGGRVRIVHFLLRTNISINAKDLFGQTALHLAAKNGHSEIVIFLLRKGADCTLEDHDGYTLRTIATYRRDGKVAQALLMQYTTDQDEVFLNAIKDIYADEDSALLVAVEANCTEIARYIIETGGQMPGYNPWPLSSSGPFDINAKSPLGEAALIIAIRKNNHAIAKCLLENGADANVRNKKGLTAFQYAVKFAEQEMLLLLEAYGAFTYFQYDYEVIALSIATERRKKDMIMFLLDRRHGIGINIGDREGSTSLHIISSILDRQSFDDPVIIKRLLEYGADIEVRDAYSRTPLLVAAATRHEIAVEELLKYKPKIGARDNRGLTPLLACLVDDPRQLAAGRSNEDIVGAILNITCNLLGHGADVNAVTTTGETAMILAVKNGHSTDLKLELLKKGASLNLRDNTNRGAMDYASGADFQTLKMLRKDVDAL